MAYVIYYKSSYELSSLLHFTYLSSLLTKKEIGKYIFYHDQKLNVTIFQKSSFSFCFLRNEKRKVTLKPLILNFVKVCLLKYNIKSDQ